MRKYYPAGHMERDAKFPSHRFSAVWGLKITRSKENSSGMRGWPFSSEPTHKFWASGCMNIDVLLSWTISSNALSKATLP